jgi:hypothetical protein
MHIILCLSLTLPPALTIVSHMHNQELPDLNLIKRQAKAQRKEGGFMAYMQGRDAASHLQYYLRTVQEYYPDF